MYRVTAVLLTGAAATWQDGAVCRISQQRLATAEAFLAGSEDFAGKRERSALGMLWYIGFSSLNTGKSLAIATQEQL